MKLNIKHKQIAILALLLVLLSIVLMQGCGDTSTQCTAPAGSTITITPAEHTFTVGGGTLGDDVNFDYTVTVLYPDGTPMPKACLDISGVLASPRNASGTGWYYQFYYYPGGNTNIGNIPVNSPFAAQTDDFGQYTFSTLISAGTGSFFDESIYVRSGSNSASAALTLN